MPTLAERERKHTKAAAWDAWVRQAFAVIREEPREATREDGGEVLPLGGGGRG